MPRYNLPHDIVEPTIIDFFGTLSLKFRVNSDQEWSKIYAHKGYRQGNFAILPLTSPYLCGPVELPSEELHVEHVDLPKREIVVRIKRKRYENMDFPKGTWVVIVDTDLPATDHFADNLCSYCTGLHCRYTADAWLKRFYSELTHPGNNIVANTPVGYYHPSCYVGEKNNPMRFPKSRKPVESQSNKSGFYYEKEGDQYYECEMWPIYASKCEWKWQNPFAKYSRCIWAENKYLTPCSPWPSPEWASNGLYDFCNLDTLTTIGGRLSSEEELKYYYQWPARMSVAIFFSKKIAEFDFNLLSVRAKSFCEGYPNSRYGGQHHHVTNVRNIEI